MLQGVRSLLTQIQAGLANEALSSSMLPAFLQSLLMSTSSLTLTKCHLDGPFNLNQAASLLPTTIEHLTLCPEKCGVEAGEVQCMNVFTRFNKLQHLQIDQGIPTGALTQADTRLFCLTEPIPSLKSLFVASHVFSVRDHLPSTLLPNMENLAVHVRHTRASGYLALPRLKYLSLMMFEQHAMPVQGYMHLQVPPHLEWLSLTGPDESTTHITVSISHPMV